MAADTPERVADCKKIFAALSDYLDQDLPVEECERIQAHIADCPPCVEFVNSLRNTIELCRTSEAPQNPVPMAEDVRRKLLDAYRQTLSERGRQP